MKKVLPAALIAFGGLLAGMTAAAETPSNADPSAIFGKQSKSLGSPNAAPAADTPGAPAPLKEPPPVFPDDAADNAASAPELKQKPADPFPTPPLTITDRIGKPPAPLADSSGDFLLNAGLGVFLSQLGLSTPVASLVSKGLLVVFVLLILLLTLRLVKRKSTVTAGARPDAAAVGAKAASVPEGVAAELGIIAPASVAVPARSPEPVDKPPATPSQAAPARTGGKSKGKYKGRADQRSAQRQEPRTEAKREEIPPAAVAVAVPVPPVAEIPPVMATPPVVEPPLAAEAPAPVEPVQAAAETAPAASLQVAPADMADPPADIMAPPEPIAEIPQPEPALAQPVTPRPPGVPDQFDIAGFIEGAKQYFILFQAAWERGDVQEVRAFSSPEMFAELELQLRERETLPGSAEVVDLDAELLGMESLSSHSLATVKFVGTAREAPDTPTADFTEVWTLSRPLSGERVWVLAGVRQLS